MSCLRRTLASTALTMLVACACTVSARATVVYTGTIAVSSPSPTQLGSLVQQGKPSDWSEPAVFPGIDSPTTPLHYTVLDLDLAALEAPYVFGGYLQVSFDSVSLDTFLSAYSGSYDPGNLATHYLADEGAAGNTVGTDDPKYFSFYTPTPGHLALVLNETGADQGLDQPGNVLVEAFSDTQYTDLALAPIPEPGTWALMLGGLAGLAGVQRRRTRTVPTHAETA